MKKYRIRLINPIFGVPVTFIEHYVPPLADRGGIGSEYTDSEKEQTTKTSELTDDTTICDTLSPLAYNKNLRSRERERESTSAEYLFRLIGHEHDLGDGTNLGQFEIVELGNGRDNFTPTKDYINPKMYKNGIESNGNAINRVLVYTIDSIPSKGVYYKADNCDKLLFAPYARVCIRCK